MSGPNLLRVLTLSLGGVTLAQIGIVFYVYMLAWKRSPHRRGLIPLHVIGVSVYTVLVQLLLMALVADRVQRDAPMSLYGPTVLVADIILMVSLGFIFRYDRRRVSAALPPGDTEVLPARRAEDRAPPDRQWWGRRR